MYLCFELLKSDDQRKSICNVGWWKASRRQEERYEQLKTSSDSRDAQNWDREHKLEQKREKKRKGRIHAGRSSDYGIFFDCNRMTSFSAVNIFWCDLSRTWVQRAFEATWSEAKQDEAGKKDMKKQGSTRWEKKWNTAHRGRREAEQLVFTGE